MTGAEGIIMTSTVIQRLVLPGAVGSKYDDHYRRPAQAGRQSLIEL